MAKGGFASYSGTQVNAVRGAANIGTDAGLVYLPPGFLIPGISSEVASAPATRGRHNIQRMSPEIDGFWFQNNSTGADMIAGVGLRLANRHWQAWEWNDGEAAGAKAALYTETQDRDATFDILMTEDDDGILIGSEIPWGWATFDIATQNDDASDTLVEYWSDASAWTLPAATSVKLAEMVMVDGQSGTGETTYIWDPAQDWGRVGDVVRGAVVTAPDTSGVLAASAELTPSQQRLRMLMERHTHQADMSRGSGVMPYIQLVSQSQNQD